MIKALIVDDEEDARQMLNLALQRYCPNVEVLGLCKSGQEGLENIEALKPNLVFLDVQMPLMSGFDMLEKVTRSDFHVIFVTAHNKYAIKAIKFSALDYLLKPIDVEELVSAVERMLQKTNHMTRSYHSLLTNMHLGPKALKRLAIPMENGLVMQEVDDIVYCEADGSYTTLFLANGDTLLVSKNIKEFENMLSENAFCRIHHSLLVNTVHVQKYIRGEGGYVMVTGDKHLNVSRRKKDRLLQLLQRL